MVAMGPVVAGTFYPADPEVLRAEIERMLGDAEPAPVEGVRAVIVPHAGYVYSGPVAATAFALLAGGAFERVVLIGPSHFSWFKGLATPAADTWSIPLGEFPIVDAALPRSQEPFRTEHCLEVQLPFLLETVGPVPITPILTGDVTPKDAAAALGGIVDDATLLVVSTDLSHYLPYETANRVDAETASAVVARRPKTLGHDSACGLTGLQAALLLARDRDWDVELLDLRNSGDTAGDRSRVVGYGAFALSRSALDPGGES
jgi:hypothetical protein